MKINPNVRIVAELSINDEEAEVLFHLCSYGLSEWFATQCSKKYTADEIKGTLQSIRSQASRVVEAHRKAVEAALRMGQ